MKDFDNFCIGLFQGLAPWLNHLMSVFEESYVMDGNPNAATIIGHSF